MHGGMTPGSIAALFVTMALLAAVPSVSTLTVAARASARGCIRLLPGSPLVRC